MQIFLEEVAAQLYRDYGSNLTEQFLVFPTRLSADYLHQHLIRCLHLEITLLLNC